MVYGEVPPPEVVALSEGRQSPSSRHAPSEHQNVQRCIVVPMKHQSAARTSMLSTGQFLDNTPCAPGASLRCPTRIDLQELRTSFFRFVAKHPDKSSPPRVVYRLRQLCSVLRDHLPDVQIFHRDHSESLDDRARELVL